MPEETRQQVFHCFARDVARIILEESWEANGVKWVLLYGSVLTSPTPQDIDLLVLHFNGAKLENYTTSWSKLEEGEEVHYHPPSTILRQLGCKEGQQTSVFKDVDRLFSERNMTQWMEQREGRPTTIDGLLDLHVLNTITITDPSFLGEQYEEFYKRNIPKLREKAIRMSGKDPTFFHRVLSEGRLYNQGTEDFTTLFEEAYPGKLDLFPKS